jgi:hypothetical protein
MPPAGQRRCRDSITMHIVVIAWLYITATMALAFHSAWAGAAFFVAAGLAPALLYAWLALRRRRAARAALKARAPRAPAQ